jgi:hypothetical protein
MLYVLKSLDMKLGGSSLPAKLQYYLRRLFPEGDLIEVKIWSIPKSDDFPEGVKYSMAYIKIDENRARRILGYDNERTKGHHKHYFDEEEDITFKDWNELVKRFRMMLQR